MRKRLFVLTAIFFLVQASEVVSRVCPARYALTFLPDAAILVDGKAEEAVWGEVPEEACFSLPWEDRAVSKTTFQAILGAQALYFFFYVVDETPFELEAEREETVAEGDRVEIFFALDESLSDYYCLEISPSARVFDYHASHYRDFEPAWTLGGLEVAAKKGNLDYSVEGAIPRSSLGQMGFSELEVGNTIRIGLFRADFEEVGGRIEQHWISWCVPPSENPDFHVPGAFGVFEVVSAN